MPKMKPIASLSGLIDTDVEDDTLNMEADAFPTPDSNQENAGPAKKKGGRAKATAKRFTKAKPVPRRVSGESIAPKKAGPQKTAKKRGPLKEQMNMRQAEETEEVDEFEGQEQEDTNMDELVEPKHMARRKVPVKKAGRPSKAGPVQQVSARERDGEFEYTPTTVRHTKTIDKPSVPDAQKANTSKPQASIERRQHEKVIPETQVPMDTEHPEFPNKDDDNDDAVPQSVYRRTNNARNSTHQRQPSAARRRAGSASDTDRGGGDPATRRKLGEMTKNFEKMEMKYMNLRENGLKDAEAKMAALMAKSQSRAKGRCFHLHQQSLVLTKYSSGRIDSLPPQGDLDPKITLSRHSRSPNTTPLSKCRPSQDTSSRRPTLHLPLRSTE